MRRIFGISVVTGAVLAALSVHAQTAVPALAPDVLKNCFECHGEGGVSTIPTRPTIAGQKAEYMVRQLRAFKRAARARAADTDRDADNQAAQNIPSRSDPVMAHMAAFLRDGDIPLIATALAGLACDGVPAPKGAAEQPAATIPPATPPASPPATPPAGQACVACHGADGISAQGLVPNLAGQKRSYLRRQLLLIRESAWGAAPRENESWRSHPIMERHAARITIQDIDVLARYYAALDCRGGAAR